MKRKISVSIDSEILRGIEKKYEQRLKELVEKKQIKKIVDYHFSNFIEELFGFLNSMPIKNGKVKCSVCGTTFKIYKKTRYERGL